jgi:hypothetical protein
MYFTDLLPLLRLRALQEGKQRLRIKGGGGIKGIRVASSVAAIVRQGGFYGGFYCASNVSSVCMPFAISFAIL